ncbi:MAG TPA: TatD family hydrolase [Anaerolineales bacterium]|nr:TatD family hydrolase [Anaerolineales bacterium]HNA87745.1 TatD family hydrolase [Anaerolineales bacterium]HNB34702.1 TatD family hydrolase [Anaerolineales bacterium]HNC08580.1 TatD family hydrolase [Anaerolineales bacterium]
MQLTDTHCHLDYDKYDPDRAEVIQRAKDSGLIRILVPGLQHRSSKEALLLAESNPMVYAAVGFHPTDLDEFSEATFQKVKELAQHPKVVAIGEIGIDYYWVKEDEKRTFQREALKQQLSFAKEMSKPVVIHMREENDDWFGQASIDLLDILAEWQNRLTGTLKEKPGVLHSFNGTLETAQKALALNFYIGVTGPVTYKNADKKREIISQIPLDRLLIETDGPFLTPVPFRGKRNEPAFVRHIADKIAEIHSKSPAEIAAQTTSNAARLFAWGD